MKPQTHRAFTIIELLAVVAIIAILIGVLLPAVGKARDKARTSTSESNLRQLAVAHQAYAADWEDRQLTLARDNLSAYGSSVADYNAATAPGATHRSEAHPPVLAGWGWDPAEGVVRLFGYYPFYDYQEWAVEPIGFPDNPSNSVDGFGWFRLPNCKQLSQYSNGHWYDPIFYAPKDPFWSKIDICLDDPHEFPDRPECNPPVWTTYCLSPAALFNPRVFSKNSEDVWFTNPWSIPAGFRVPSMSDVSFPSLKTHMLEHPWLQNLRTTCNPNFLNAWGIPCEPYYFNMGWESAPATLFYDGSVRLMGVQEALDSDRRFRSQNGGEIGLWTNQTSFGGDYAPSGVGGYLSDYAYDWTSTSYHILTTEGARGRDTIGTQ